MFSNFENGISAFFKKEPEILTVLHDSENSFKVFLHALSITCHLKGKLEILDVRRDNEAIEHIGVRDVLQRWEKKRNSFAKDDMDFDGIKVKKRILIGKKLQKIKEQVTQKKYDFTIASTGLTNDLPVPFRISQDKTFINQMDHSLLLVPSNTDGFVNESNGRFTVNSILFPIFRSVQLPHLDKAISFLKYIFSDSNPDISAVSVNSSLSNTDFSSTAVTWKKAFTLKNIEKNMKLTIREHDPEVIAFIADRNKRFAEIKRFAGRFIKNACKPVFLLVAES